MPESFIKIWKKNLCIKHLFWKCILIFDIIFFYTDPTILEYGDILNSYFINEIIVNNRVWKLRDCCKIPERNLNWSGGRDCICDKNDRNIDYFCLFNGKVMTMEVLFIVLAFCCIYDFNLEKWTEGHCG